MERMIAMCGLDCGPCDARLATQANDEAAKERIAAKWREEFHSPDIDAVYVTCDGCLSGSTRVCGWARQCPLRACGIPRGVATCGHCQEFESCATLAGFFQMVPTAKERLEKIRAAL